MSSLAPLATLAVVLVIDLICLADVARARELRYLSRWGWAALILLTGPFGALFYVLAGRAL